MLTNHDIEVFETTGNITPDRIEAVIYALHHRASDARLAALDQPSVPAAAALRGKARGYIEAADMLKCLRESRPIPLPLRVRRARRRRLDEHRATKKTEPA